jgi:RND family efflux transporter MFP subunit
VANLKDDLASLRIDADSRAGDRRSGVWIVVAVLLLALLGAGGWFFSQRLQATSVKTAAVAARANGAGAAAGSVLNASGYITARRRATVSSKVTGKVLQVYVDEGKEVKKGQILARLDDSQIRAALEVARAQLGASQRSAAEDEARLREAQLTLDRRARLVKEGVVGIAEVDEARATVESLKARIALAEQQVQVAQAQVSARQTDLADMVVRAPFDGIAISKDAQPGEMISPVSAGGGFTRTGICTIVDMSSLEIEVDVNESYINRVHTGQRVEATLDAYPDWRIPAHVITTIPSADRQKATVKVRIGFDELDPRILPDMGVKVSFLRDAETAARPAAAPAVLVPKAAVRTVDGRTVVFVVVRDLHKVYHRGGERIDVLQGVTLDIPAGDFLALMGPSGSGKTTLLNLLGGLDTPTEGSITVAGDRIDKMAGGRLSAWRARHIGFVFQMYNLLPVLTAARNVELPLLLTKLGSADRKRRVQVALSVVGLAERANHYPRQLSGGQEQRVGIARAIVTDPTLLLCDEPTGDLDRRSGDEVLDLLQTLNQEYGKTIVMVTHDPHAAVRARRTLHLEKGLLVAEAVA